MRSFRPLSRALVDYHLERGVMPLCDAVGVNCNSGRKCLVYELGVYVALLCVRNLN